MQDSGSPSSLSRCDCSLASAALIGFGPSINQACFRLDHLRMIDRSLLLESPKVARIIKASLVFTSRTPDVPGSGSVMASLAPIE